VTTPECGREQDLLDALAAGRWPDGEVSELRMHVDGCGSCQDLLTVALPLLLEQALAQRDARIPSSAVVWWRAQTRARREAVEAATRPITLVQGLALACGAGLVAGIATVTQPAVRQWLAWGAAVVASFDPRTIDLARLHTLATAGMLPLVALGVGLLIAPIAIYLAVGNE
jgi:hypothetical protein